MTTDKKQIEETLALIAQKRAADQEVAARTPKPPAAARPVEFRFDCDACRDSGYTDDGFCSCKYGDRQREQHRRMEMARQQAVIRRLSVLFSGVAQEHARMEELLPFDLRKHFPEAALRGKGDALKLALRFAGRDKTNKPVAPDVDQVVCVGPTGTGKSALWNWASRMRAADLGGIPLHIHWNQLLELLQWVEPADRKARLRAVCEAPVLVLDDLGDPFSTNGRLTDDRRQLLRQILDAREWRKLPTVIISNIEGDKEQFIAKFSAQFDPPSAGRLSAYEFVQMGGANLREL